MEEIYSRSLRVWSRNKGTIRAARKPVDQLSREKGGEKLIRAA